METHCPKCGYPAPGHPNTDPAYRSLTPGETIQEGDEFEQSPGYWRPVGPSIGDTPCEGEEKLFRRKL